MTHDEQPDTDVTMQEISQNVASDEAEAGQKRGFWAWLAGLFGQNGDIESQYDMLNESIRQNPQAPTAYVLRGELHLKQRQYALAKVDFERAVALTDEQIDEARWGIVAQAMRDRAERGLMHKHIVRLSNGE